MSDDSMRKGVGNITFEIINQLNPITRQEDDLFIIGESSGIVKTNAPMSPFKDEYFDLNIKASEASKSDSINYDAAHLLVSVQITEYENSPGINENANGAPFIGLGDRSD